MKNGSLLCPDCGHHLHRPNPGICQWYDCGCPAEAAAPADDPEAPMHTDEEYIEYGVQQYRRGRAQAEYEASHATPAGLDVEAQIAAWQLVLTEAHAEGSWQFVRAKASEAIRLLRGKRDEEIPNGNV